MREDGRSPRRLDARVRANETVGKDCLLLTLEVPEIARIIEPAQFLMLRGPEGRFPYLPRPFSVCDLVDDRGADGLLQVLYHVMGEGTEAMAGWREGETVSCLGPLGHPYTFPRGDFTPIFLAGGIGIAPFPLLARRLPVDPRKAILLFGARTADGLYGFERMREIGVQERLATDDGSAGRKGTAVDLLVELLETEPPENPVVFACGPTPMFKAAQAVVQRFGVPCQMSLEERMACGYGACVGCAQAISDPTAVEGWRYALICTEGPVFPAETILYARPSSGKESPACSVLEKGRDS
jgi:dihydroorotate dehydrogenase electron transfer subunit